MKKISNLMKLLAIILVSVLGISNTVTNVNAAPSTITLSGNTETTPKLIGNTFFTSMRTTDGGYVYCMDIHKTTVRNQTMTLVGEKDAGFAYIMQNGYPAKNITGNRIYDIYITQTALWWYLDSTTGSTNLTNVFKSTGQDSYGLRGHVVNLVNGALAARNNGYAKTSIAVNNTNKNMTLSQDKKYFVSSAIGVTASNIGKYSVSLTNAPAGTIITNTSGAQKNEFAVNEQFLVKVPADKATTKDQTININVNATGTVYKAYEYRPADTNTYQNVIPAVLSPETQTVTANTSVSYSTTQLTITKIDKKTKKAIAGAELVLKDSKGTTIATWKSTTSGYVIKHLAAGTYTVEEKTAPKGYKKLTSPVKINITSQTKDVKVTIDNEAKTNVVNITKIDAVSEQVLPGAVLVVKNSKGKQIAKFTTTNEPYVLTDLEEGTYTVEEISAPEGYKKSTEVKKFTIDDDHTSIQVTFENYPDVKEVIVPDTQSHASIFMYLIGTLFISIAAGFVYKNAKKEK